MMGRDLSGVKVTVFMLRITDNLVDEIVDNLIEPDVTLIIGHVGLTQVLDGGLAFCHLIIAEYERVGSTTPIGPLHLRLETAGAPKRCAM
jgi:hypothetical protein